MFNKKDETDEVFTKFVIIRSNAGQDSDPSKKGLNNDEMIDINNQTPWFKEEKVYPRGNIYHNMKGNKEDDDEPNSANGSMQDLSVHVKLEHQPNCSSFQLMQLREAACSREFTSLQNSYVSRSFSERIYFHIGGFWDIYVQIPITMMNSIFCL